MMPLAPYVQTPQPAHRVAASIPLVCRSVVAAVLLMVACLGVAAGTPSWQWAHPLPHGNNVADLIHWGGLYLHVTERGGIYSSTDRLNWERLGSGTDRDLRGAAPFAGRVLVVGEEGTVLWSEDGRTYAPGVLTPPTTDWLEGVAASASGAVAVGDNAAIYRTVDGKNWSRVAGLPFTAWLTGVAQGAGVFVAVGDGGLIASSPDGAAWTRRTSGTTTDLFRVAFGDGRFLAVGRNGVVLTSTNGSLWTTDLPTAVTNALYAAVPSAGERLAVGDSAFLLRRPPAGWVDQSSEVGTPSPVPAWSWSAAVWDGQRHLVGGRTGVFVESWRTNSGVLAGESFWLRNDDSPRNLLWEVARFENTYLAVGDVGTVLSSAAGVAWTAEGAPVSPETVLYGVGGSSTTAIAVGSAGTVLRSTDERLEVLVTNRVEFNGVTHPLITTNTLSLLGVLWEPATAVTTNDLQGVTWGHGRFVATGARGTTLVSSNGIDWLAASVGSTAVFLSSVAASAEGFVAVGTGGAVYTSPNGTAWTPRRSGTTNWLYRVRQLGGILLATGPSGTLLTSADGVGWVSRPTGSSAFLTDACRVGGAYYVSATGGSVLRSTNLVDWEGLSLPTRKGLFGLATDGVQVVAAGAEGVILRAIGDPGGLPVAFAAHAMVRSGPVPAEAFVFRGSPGQPFRLESAETPGPWGEPSASLTLDANGAATLALPAPQEARFHRTAAGP